MWNKSTTLCPTLSSAILFIIQNPDGVLKLPWTLLVQNAKIITWTTIQNTIHISNRMTSEDFSSVNIPNKPHSESDIFLFAQPCFVAHCIYLSRQHLWRSNENFVVVSFFARMPFCNHKHKIRVRLAWASTDIDVTPKVKGLFWPLKDMRTISLGFNKVWNTTAALIRVNKGQSSKRD